MQQPAAASINAIGRESVHRICSGQVVLTLAVAVKELVENSLDAGATSVEVKTKEYGCECIEVVDNGSGVEEHNFEGLTLKHHTSKIGSFEDVEGVQTFGFRGEALSSLCAMSKLIITTRHASAVVGTRLEFDSHGAIVSRTSCPRPVGTTVSVQELFCALPVRHKEFLRNSKKEFARMLNLLTAYALISTNVRLTCSNQTAGGKRAIALSTNGNARLLENIADVFGVKQLDNLVCFDGTSPTGEICHEFGIRAAHVGQLPFRVVGYVSSCALSDGRSAADRQYYYVNGRPCELSKVARVVNETYRTFNFQQYPFAVLDVSFDSGTVDVNVTPDKRLILIEHEALLLAVVKASLLKMYGSEAASVLSGRDDHLRVALPEGCGDAASGANERKDTLHEASQQQPAKRALQALYERLEKDGKAKKRCLDAFVERTRGCLASPPTLRDVPPHQSKPSQSADGPPGWSCEGGGGGGSPVTVLDRLPLEEDEDELATAADSLDSAQLERRTSSPLLRRCGGSAAAPWPAAAAAVTPRGRRQLSAVDAQPCVVCSGEISRTPSASAVVACGLPESSCVEGIAELESSPSVLLQADSSGNGFSLAERGDAAATAEVARRLSPAQFAAEMLDSPARAALDSSRRERPVRFSMEELRVAARVTAEQRSTSERNEALRFKAKIVPTENERAEEELSAALGKEKFKEMEMVGQFNLGFVIARLQRDLFIVDQHASDEKYNFELLQKTTTLKRQKLVQPVPLHLTAANELVLMGNLDVFAQNGFEFMIDETAQPTTRVKLTAQPVSKNWSFGKEDIDEMLFMLNESPGRHCRPARVRAMFASRACRKSVMIGTALKEAEMLKLVRQLAELDHPWNCPHGRPTIRHVVNLDLLTGSDD